MTAEDLSQALRATPDYQAMLKSNPSNARQWEQNLMREAGVQLGREATISSPKPVIPALGPEPVARPDLPSIVPSQETAEGATGFLKRAALPTAGAVVGGMVSPGMGIPLGGMAGEAANQIFGITEPSLTQVGLQGIVPTVAKGGAAALQRAPKMLPGASAALQEEGVRVARGLPAKAIAAPARSSDELFGELAAGPNPSIPTTNLAKAAADLASKEAKVPGKRLKDTEIVGLADDFKDTASLSIGEIQGASKRLNALIRDRTKQDELRGAYKHLKEGLQKDLEAAAQGGTSEAKTLKEAWKSYRRESAQENLAEIIEKRGIQHTDEYLERINPNSIGDWIKNNKFFRESVDATELKEIEKTLKELSQIPRVPVKRGQPIGSGRRLGMLGLGAAAGGYAGGGIGAAVGAFAVDKGSDLIARALMSDTGRKALIKIVTANGGRFGQDEAALLSAYVTGGVSHGAELQRQLTP